jgi:hypothetical protein
MNNDSTGFMNYQSGLQAIEPLAGSRGADTFSARLNTDSIPMLPTDAFGAYTEPLNTSGYAAILNPAFGIAAVGDGWEASLNSIGWFLHSPPGETVTIYGWWYQDDDSDVVICAGNIRPPFVAPPGGAALTIGPVTMTSGSCTASAPVLADGGFEAPVIPAATFTVNPAWPAGSWVSDSFGGAGQVLVASAGSAYEPPAGNPEGRQYLILQSTAAVTQVVSIGTAGVYRLVGAYAQRSTGFPATVVFSVDGVGIDTFSGIASAWTPFGSTSFSVAAGDHTIGLTGSDTLGLDQSMFFDMLSLLSVP